MDQNPSSVPDDSQPIHPTEPYPHHDLPLEVPEPPVNPVAPQPSVWTVPTPLTTPAPVTTPQPVAPVAPTAWTPPAPAPATGTASVWSSTPLPPAAPTPPTNGFNYSLTAGQPDSDGVRPVPVVRVLSPVGVEYVFLTFTLLAGALGLTTALISMVNGAFDFAVLSFPAALLLVSVPLFAVIFLHLKKLELARPELKLDPSKRRSTQFTQIAMFVVCFFTLIGLVFDIFANLGGQGGLSVGKAILNAGVVLLVAGGILAYYWHDEHRNRA